MPKKIEAKKTKDMPRGRKAKIEELEEIPSIVSLPKSEPEPKKLFNVPGLHTGEGIYRIAPKSMKSRHWRAADSDDPQRKGLARPLSEDEELFYRVKSGRLL